MSKPNAYKMYQELATHYAIERGSKSVSEWQKAIKKAAGGENDSVDVLWDKWKATPPKEVVIEPKRVEAPVVPKVVKPEVVSTMRATEAVVVNVHVPEAVQAQVVEYPARDWLGVSTRFASWCQTMAFGMVVGVLVSKHVLKMMGL